MSDLQRAVEALWVPSDFRRVQVVPSLNRVMVRLTMLDDAVADLLAGYPQAVPDPLVVKSPR